MRVTDAEVAEATRAYRTNTHDLAQGTGAAPLAALMREREPMRGKTVGLIPRGGNIGLPLARRVPAGGARRVRVDRPADAAHAPPRRSGSGHVA